MFEIKHLTGNTYFYEAFTNVGVCRTTDGKVVLIDSCDHKRMVKSLDRELEAMGLKVSAVINTHGHNDHIVGNRFFQDKYGCKLLSTKLEQTFICNPFLEAEFYNSALTVDSKSNPFLDVQPSNTEVITRDNLPEDFDIVALPGHSFEMIGVRTPDDVLFLADSVLSVDTWESYKYPFFRDVNKSVDTLEKIKELKACLFVPSHNGPVEDIYDLAQYNIEKHKEKKQLIYELCNGKSFEELFASVMQKEELSIKTPKYAMYAVMIKNYLQSLIEDKLIYNELESNIMRYNKK